MKTLICLLTLFTGIKIATAQDTIIQTDGTKTISIVQEVGTSEIKYKKYDTRLSSPVYDISKYQVSAIHYADGTKDVFPPSVSMSQPISAPIPQSTYVITTYNPDGTVTTSPSSLTGATMYIGALVSPLTPYDNNTINSYFQNKFSQEGNGTIKLSNGTTQMYNYFMGGSLIFNKQDNWSYEFQFETTPATAIHDTAHFDNGASGNLVLSYFSLNDALQYLRGTDTSNRFQIGGELSADIGIFSGTEHDITYEGNSYPTNNSVLYDGMQFGWHAAAVAKYFVGKSKNLGFEMKLGYRDMYLKQANEFDGTGSPVNFNGLMLSMGITLQFKAQATVCVNCYDYNG
jgi:hypothetical protein